jgi:pyrroline-5-carboxylate reductase
MFTLKLENSTFAQKKEMTIGIVGCGNLGLSLLNGIRQNDGGIKIIGSRRNIAELEKLEIPNTQFTPNNAELIKASDIIIIALKPYNVLSFLEDNAQYFDPERHSIISVASSITMTEMGDVLGDDFDIFRAMPNTAASVNESITAISIKNDHLGRKNKIEELFNTLGQTIIIDEKLMESATILGACGIAYVLRFMRAMIQGGIEVGFDAKTATKIVSQTVKGAAELIIQNGTHPEEEIDRVTTPKGCTIVGLNEMEHSGFSSALIKGIVASYEKIEKE